MKKINNRYILIKKSTLMIYICFTNSKIEINLFLNNEKTY
jgi:hypothetical protein